jgi:broad specificity phosphatase PhoE
MTDLLLIRHATNDWVGDRLAGWTPAVHLNEPGRHQAAALAERLASWPIEAIYSSPLERAVETAQAVAAGRNLPVLLEDGIGEADYGDWTGPADQRSGQDAGVAPGAVYAQPGLLPQRRGHGRDAGPRRGGGRAPAPPASQRVLAIFSHADVIKAVAAHYVGMPFDLFQRLMIDTASVTWLRFTSHGPRLMRLNDTGISVHTTQ